MARMYLSTQEFLAMPISQAPQVASMLSNLPVGSLDSLIQRASQRVDDYCERRIGAPPTTTLSANVSAGATTISITSTLGFDNLSQQAVQVGTGSAQELVEIVSGGVMETPNVGVYSLPPYPGTLTLATPLQNGHSAGDPVIGYLREVSEAGGSSTSDPYTEALLTQTAQLALAHLPPSHMELTRVVLVDAYPIIGVPLLIEHAYSFDATYQVVDISQGLSIEGPLGLYRFNIGTVVLQEGLIRTTYQGGYVNVPDSIKRATSLYAALELMQYINPFGLVQQTMGKRSLRWQPTAGKHQLELDAENALKRYKRMV